jgi:hypothetical protein
MGTINLVAGTAGGKIGVNQYQTHGLTCVVRTKQPAGLTNQQATDINKPVLDALSITYKKFASYIIGNYPTDWKKPMAKWNFYTGCNAMFFKSGVTAKTGLLLSDFRALPDCTGYYLYTDATESAFIYLTGDSPVAFLNQEVTFIFGIDTKAISECVFVNKDVSQFIAGIPFAEAYKAAGAVMMFFRNKQTGKSLYGCIALTPMAYPEADFVGNTWYTTHYIPFGNFTMAGTKLVVNSSIGQWSGNRLVIA